MTAIARLFRVDGSVDSVGDRTWSDLSMDAVFARPQLPRFRRHYFTERIEDGTLTFDYRLREGDIAPRNALAVLELAGFPADVLEDARRLAAS